MRTFINKFGNEVKTPFDIGDVVRLKDSGNCYEYYETAFEAFGLSTMKHVPNMTAHNGTVTKSRTRLKIPNDYKSTNWRLVDYRVHENEYNILGLFKDPRGNYLVFDITEDKEYLSDYIEVNERVTSIFKGKKKINENKLVLTKIIK